MEVCNMSLIKCPKCGEMFSDSYKTCPFCAEDEAYYGGRLKKSRGRRAVEGRKKKAPSALGPVAVIVLVLLLALVVWLLFGEQIKEKLGMESDTPPISNVDNDKDNTDTPDDSTPVTPTISLNRTILSLSVGDKETLKVSGSEETVSWESSDPTLVTVTSSGEVTALAKGTAVITAKVGDESVTCTVTVKEVSDTSGDTDKTDTGKTDTDKTNTDKTNTNKTDTNKNTKVDVSKLTLKTSFDTTIYPNDGTFDVSLPVGLTCDFTVEGTSLTPAWSSKNSSIATVSSSGSVKTVSRGETTLIIKLGSTEIECLLRVTS